ncbi:hypothetical protein [Vreelandella sp.]|uniref:phage tail fiber protein n=1 Tax=Vreelandella sp. TaxID=3137778 RepID=UPI003BAC8D5E
MAAPTNYDQTNEWLAEVGRLTQELINLLKGGIDVGQTGTLGNLALIDSLSNAPVGDASTLRANIDFAAATLTEMRKYGIGSNGPASRSMSSMQEGGLYANPVGDALNPIGNNSQVILTKYSSIFGTGMILGHSPTPELYLQSFRSGAWTGLNFKVYTAGNTTVDSNGFIKSASPIFRLASSGENAANKALNFTSAGSGAANLEAQGVIATHDALGVYTINGSLGFAKQGWMVEVPQDANGNRLCVLETEQADDGTITVRTFSKRIDPDTGDVVADQPMDIPEGRWIDLRLSMPEPPTNDHPDDAPESPAPLTPEEQEQQRIEQLERWRASAAITPRQARLVLAKHGLLTSVTDAISAIEDEQQRQVAEIEWEYATSIERAAPWVNVLYGALGLSQEDVDELFREAVLV